MNENDLIPDYCGDLPQGPWLVLAPHADDETFGMGGAILGAKARGIKVHVIVLTDGAQANSSLNTQQLVETRESEAKLACKTLGVSDCAFWRLPDRGLNSDDAVVERLISVITALNPASVFAPSVLEFHPDHRATTDLAWRALKQLEFTAPQLVLYDITTLGPCNLLINITEFKDQKREVMALYQSQVQEHRYITLVESLNSARTLSLSAEVTAAESFYTLSPTHYPSLEQAIQPWFERHFERNKEEQPLVSVIVRTQGRPELSQALASLAHQTHNCIDLVVVNDGGKSLGFSLDAFSKQFNSFTYLENNKPQGRAAAANQGMATAIGDYFMFLDDDDWLDARHISKLVEAHKTSNALVCYTGVRAVQIVDNTLETLRVFDEKFDRNRLYYENYIPINAVLIARKVIDDGIHMDTSLEVFEDWDFWLQLCQLTIQFVHVPGVTAQYRISESNGIGLSGGYSDVRRRLYARWATTLGVDELEDLMSRLTLLSKLRP